MSDIELLPCPFCGGKPLVRRESGDERDGYAAHVSYVCSGCGCARGARGNSGNGGYADNSTVEVRAVESWNARVVFTAVDMANAARDGFRDGAASKEKIIDALLNHCEDGECQVCSQIICPHGEPLHFHHDGCPSCAQDEETVNGPI